MSSSPPRYHPAIRVEGEGHIATVTIDSPESRNACTGDMWVALGRTFKELDHSGVRAIVRRGRDHLIMRLSLASISFGLPFAAD